MACPTLWSTPSFWALSNTHTRVCLIHLPTVVLPEALVWTLPLPFLSQCNTSNPLLPPKCKFASLHHQMLGQMLITHVSIKYSFLCAVLLLNNNKRFSLFAWPHLIKLNHITRLYSGSCKSLSHTNTWKYCSVWLMV